MLQKDLLFGYYSVLFQSYFYFIKPLMPKLPKNIKELVAYPPILEHKVVLLPIDIELLTSWLLSLLCEFYSSLRTTNQRGALEAISL